MHIVYFSDSVSKRMFVSMELLIYTIAKSFTIMAMIIEKQHHYIILATVIDIPYQPMKNKHVNIVYSEIQTHSMGQLSSLDE